MDTDRLILMKKIAREKLFAHASKCSECLIMSDFVDVFCDQATPLILTYRRLDCFFEKEFKYTAFMKEMLFFFSSQDECL